MRGNFEFVSFCQGIFDDKKNKIDICDIPLCSNFVSDDNNLSPYAITCIFQPCITLCYFFIGYLYYLLISI